MALASSLPLPLTVFSITDFGAVADGKTINTAAIQTAIDAAHDFGGGVVRFPGGGSFLTGGLNLTSNVYLHLDDGAMLQGSSNYDDYPYDWDFWDIVHAEGATNCGILGSGANSTIRGPMWDMVKMYDPVQNQLQPITWEGVRGCRGECRPRGIVFVDCTDVTVSNFSLQDSADWSSLYRRCDNVLISDMSISGSKLWPNNDGIDLESGSNITITRLDISTGDDGIVFVSGNTNDMNHPWPETAPYSPLRGVHVSDVRVQSRSSALKFESIFQREHGDVFDVTIENVEVHGSNRGIGFQQRTGSGSFHGVLLRNITVQTEFVTGTNWWGAGEGIWMTSVPEGAEVEHLGSIYDIAFFDVDVVAPNGALISTRDRFPAPFDSGKQCVGICNVLFDNVRYKVVAPTNTTRPIHDFRPIDGSIPGGTLPFYDSLVDGFFIENASEISFSGLEISFEGAVQSYWNKGSCVRTENSSVSYSGHYDCAPAAAQLVGSLRGGFR